MALQASRRGMLISKAWLQAAVLVFLFGFFMLGLLAVRTYQAQPPIPARVLAPDDAVVFTGEDVRAGQQVFLGNGLMEFGSVFGHGGYLGPDFTADYLRRAAEVVQRASGGEEAGRQRTIGDFKTNRHDPATGELRFTAAQADAFREVRAHYQEYFSAADTRHGEPPCSMGVGAKDALRPVPSLRHARRDPRATVRASAGETTPRRPRLRNGLLRTLVGTICRGVSSTYLYTTFEIQGPRFKFARGLLM